MEKIDVLNIVSWWVISGPIFLCGAIEKGKEWIFEWKSGLLTALAEGRKVKLYFQARAFQLTMRTDFPLSEYHLHSLVAWVGIYCPERMALPRKDQNLSNVPAWNFNIHKPFVSTSWEEIAWCLSASLSVTSSKSVWANIKYQVLLEATNLENKKWLVTMHIGVLVSHSNQIWDAGFSCHVS